MTKKEKNNLEIGKKKLAKNHETGHILVLGSTGSGLSVLIKQVIHSILKRKDEKQTREKLIIYDVKGDFLS